MHVHHCQLVFLLRTQSWANSRILSQLSSSLQICRSGRSIAGRGRALPGAGLLTSSWVKFSPDSMSPIRLAALLRVSDYWAGRSGVRISPIFWNHCMNLLSRSSSSAMSCWTACCSAMQRWSSRCTYAVTSSSSSRSSLTFSLRWYWVVWMRVSSCPMYSSIFWSCFSLVTNSSAMKVRSSLPLYSFITVNMFSRFSPNLLQFYDIFSFSLFEYIMLRMRSLARGRASVMISLELSPKFSPVTRNWSLRLSKGITLELRNSSPRNDFCFMENFRRWFSSALSTRLTFLQEAWNSPVLRRFTSLSSIIFSLMSSLSISMSSLILLMLALPASNSLMSSSSLSFICLCLLICLRWASMVFRLCAMWSVMLSEVRSTLFHINCSSLTRIECFWVQGSLALRALRVLLFCCSVSFRKDSSLSRVRYFLFSSSTFISMSSISRLRGWATPRALNDLRDESMINDSYTNRASLHFLVGRLHQHHRPPTPRYALSCYPLVRLPQFDLAEVVLHETVLLGGLQEQRQQVLGLFWELPGLVQPLRIGCCE